MTKSIELLTREEKILLDTIRSSNISVTKLLNEIGNVYRETQYHKPFVNGLNKLHTECIELNRNVCLFCCDDNIDYSYIPMYLTVIIGASKEELQETVTEVMDKMYDNNTRFPEEDNKPIMEYRHEVYIKAFNDKGWLTLNVPLVGEDINGEVFSVDYEEYNGK
jgi:hypothetical protein